MTSSNPLLLLSGLLCFFFFFFQAAIGFSPSLSLYFGAPEFLVQDRLVLVGTSLAISLLATVSGCYALSGAGKIRPLPGLKWVLVALGGIFFLRGILFFPEALAVAGIIQSPIPLAPRFVVFSLLAFIAALIFITGLIKGWKNLPRANPTP